MTVYYLRADNGAIKIGHSGNVNNRVLAIKTASPLNLEMVAQEKGGLELEKQRHDQFREARIQGEWFYPYGSLNKHIESLNPDYKPLPYVGVDDYYKAKSRLDNMTKWIATDGKNPPQIAYLTIGLSLLMIPVLIFITKNDIAINDVVFLALSPVFGTIVIGYILIKIWQFRVVWKNTKRDTRSDKWTI